MREKLNSVEKKTFRFIRNQLIHDLKHPSVRDIMKHLGYKSTRSASKLIASLIEKDYISRDDDTKELRISPFRHANEKKHNIPLVGAVTCGQPILAIENIEAYIPYKVKGDPKNYFFLRAMGDSMNKSKTKINDGDFVLIKKQSDAEVGDEIVALIDDEATIKVYKKEKDKIVLEPKSSNPKHKPLYIFEDFLVQGKVVGKIKN